MYQESPILPSLTCPIETSWGRPNYLQELLISHYNNYYHFPGQGASLLSPGIHSFPFKLGLPLGLPSTFLGKHGWVQYFCKTALREPNGLTHKNQQVFIVMNPIDLNLEPSILGVSYVRVKACPRMCFSAYLCLWVRYTRL